MSGLCRCNTILFFISRQLFLVSKLQVSEPNLSAIQHSMFNHQRVCLLVWCGAVHSGYYRFPPFQQKGIPLPFFPFSLVM